MATAEQTLAKVNKIAESLVPLIGVVSQTARGLVAIFRANGQHDEAQTLEDALAEVEGKREGLKSAIDEFNAEFPKA